MSTNDKVNKGDARRKAVDAVKAGKEIEKTGEFWEDTNKSVMMDVLRARGNIKLGTEAGVKEVDMALDKMLAPFAAAAGWQTLEAIPQGKELEAKFKKELRVVMAQALASSGPLNAGYGLKAPSKASETPETEVDEDGLLTSGSTPESAIDVDNEKDEKQKSIKIKLGQLYESRLRQIGRIYTTAENDSFKPIKLLIWQILCTFKKSAQQAKVWNVFRYSIDVQMPYDGPKQLSPGNIVVSLCPENIPRDIIRDLAVGAPAGWLETQHVELFFMYGRPQHRDGMPFYLPDSCTGPLDPGLQELHRNLGFSLNQLYQQVRDKKSIDIDTLQKALGPLEGAAFNIPQETSRVFFTALVNTNHFVVVAYDVCTNNIGAKMGEISVYDSMHHDPGTFAGRLRKYAMLLGSIKRSPLGGVNWMTAPVVAGISPAQRNSSDCGLLAVENLLAIARGGEPSANDPMSSRERRQTYLELVLNMLKDSTGIEVGVPEDRDDDGNGEVSTSAVDKVIAMVSKFTLAHWQYMITQAQPHLVNDYAGQLRNIKRLFPRILDSVESIGPFDPVTMPEDALPRAALVLNDHDIAPTQPSTFRKPDLIVTLMRQSRHRANGLGQSAESSADVMVKSFVQTYHPGSDLEWFQVMKIFITISSTVGFLGLAPDGGFVTHHSQVNADVRGQVQSVLDALSFIDARYVSGRRPLVEVLQVGIDGSTTDPKSLDVLPGRYPNVDFRMNVFSNHAAHARQPVDGAFTPDHTGKRSWSHFWFTHLAAKSRANNFGGLGPHLDAHNQMAYLMERIGQFKLANKGVLTKEHRAQWPLESMLTGTGSRTITRAKQIRFEELWARSNQPKGPVCAGGEKYCQHKHPKCLKAECVHFCCWGYGGPEHFEKIHGTDVHRDVVFKDLDNRKKRSTEIQEQMGDLPSPPKKQKVTEDVP